MVGPACANGEPSVPGRPPRPHQRGPGAATRGHAGDGEARRRPRRHPSILGWPEPKRGGEGDAVRELSCWLWDPRILTRWSDRGSKVWMGRPCTAAELIFILR